MNEETKVKVKNFLDRRQHTTEENLRLAGIICIVLVVVGLFLPFIKLNTDLGMITDDKGRETSLLDLDSSAVEFSAGDFVFQKGLEDFEIYGTNEIFGINVVEALTTPLPSFDFLSDSSSELTKSLLDFLVDKDFVKFCNDYFGEFGPNIVEIGKTIYNVAHDGGKELETLTTFLNDLNEATEGIRAFFSTIEGYLTIIDIIFLVVFILLIGSMILFISGRGPNKLPLILMIVISVLLLAIGIVVCICNGVIGEYLGAANGELNTLIQAWINSVIPGSMPLLCGLFAVDKIDFAMHINLVCGAGWWLMTIGSVGAAVLAFIVEKMKGDIDGVK